MVDDFLESHPEKKWEAYYIEDLDLKNVFSELTEMINFAQAKKLQREKIERLKNNPV